MRMREGKTDLALRYGKFRKHSQLSEELRNAWRIDLTARPTGEMKGRSKLRNAWMIEL